MQFAVMNVSGPQESATRSRQGQAPQRRQPAVTRARSLHHRSAQRHRARLRKALGETRRGGAQAPFCRPGCRDPRLSWIPAFEAVKKPSRASQVVVPAKAGTQGKWLQSLDSRLRGNDEKRSQTGGHGLFTRPASRQGVMTLVPHHPARFYPLPHIAGVAERVAVDEPFTDVH